MGKISILTNIFQRGWNHQLDIYLGMGELLLLGMVNRLNSSIETRRQKSDWRWGLWQWHWLCGKTPEIDGKGWQRIATQKCCEIVKKIGYSHSGACFSDLIVTNNWWMRIGKILWIISWFSARWFKEKCSCNYLFMVFTKCAMKKPSCLGHQGDDSHTVAWGLFHKPWHKDPVIQQPVFHGK